MSADRITITLADGTTAGGSFADVREALRQIHREGRPPMKPDPEFDDHNSNAYAVTAAELRQFIETIEAQNARKADIAQEQKETFAEAKGRGYDTKAIRKLVALRKRKPDDVAEEEAVLDLYKAALGMS